MRLKCNRLNKETLNKDAILNGMNLQYDNVVGDLNGSSALS